MSNKKHKWIAITLAIVLIAVAAMAAFLIVQQSQQNHTPSQETASPSAPADEEEEQESPQPELSDTPYENSQLGFSLRYPEEWIIVECEGRPNVYFGSDERGVGMTDGASILCGGGTDFPAQVSVRTEEKADAERALASQQPTTVTIDGQEVQKVTYTNSAESLHPHLENTMYFVERENDYVVFRYAKWPAGADYDTSEESKNKFIHMMEETLRFTD